MQDTIDFDEEIARALILAKGELKSIEYQYREIKSRVALLEKQQKCDHDVVSDGHSFLLCCDTCKKCGYSVFY